MRRYTQINLLLACTVLCGARFCFAEPPATTRPSATRSTSLRVSFLDVPEAKGAIIDDSAEPYFDRLSPQEMSVKTGSPITGRTLEEQRAECRARYQAACDTFTDDEKALLTALLEQLQPDLQRDYPRFAAQPWSFVKVKPTLEQGFAHTRGNHIILSPPMLDVFRRMQAGHVARSSSAQAILVHEQTHVIERAHPKWFVNLYTDVLGFREAKEIEPDQWITDRQLLNPDGVECRWVFPIKSGSETRWIWPLLLFSEPTSKSLTKMQMVGIELESKNADSFKTRHGEDGTPIRTPLRSIPEYMDAISTGQDIYHPNEIAADLMAWLVTDPNGSPPRVRDWARATFRE